MVFTEISEPKTYYLPNVLTWGVKFNKKYKKINIPMTLRNFHDEHD